MVGRFTQRGALQLLVLVISLTGRVSTQDCIQEGQCMCRLDDGSGVFDLSPLGRSSGHPLIYKALTDGGYQYSFNPCYPFSLGTCIQVAGCQYDPYDDIYYDIGYYESTHLMYDNETNGVTARYRSSRSPRMTEVTFICDPTADYPRHNILGEVAPALYVFEITSKFACLNSFDVTTERPSDISTEPFTIEPLTSEPVTPEPPYIMSTGPLTIEPLTSEPVTPEPPYIMSTEPLTKEPLTSEPVTPEPPYIMSTEPLTIEPLTSEPVTPEPPYIMSTEPLTKEPLTSEPVTPEPPYIMSTEPSDIQTTEPSDVTTPEPSTTPAVKRVCYKIDQCGCEFNDGSGVLDLNKVGRKDGAPLIDREYTGTADTFTYSFNPCYPFDEGECENAAGCQHNTENKSLYYDIGDAKRVTFTAEDDDTVVATYVSIDGTRQSVVKYICNPDMAITAHKVDGEIADSTYGFTIIGKDLCPQSSVEPSTPLTTLPSTTRIDIKKECTKINACMCEFNDGSGTLDLSELGREDGTALIYNEFAADNYAYSFNPCYPFTVGTCTNVAGCQYDDRNIIYYDIGDQSDVTFTYDGQNVIGTYATDESGRMSVVTYICDEEAISPTYEASGEVNLNVYKFTIRAKAICPVTFSTSQSAEFTEIPDYANDPNIEEAVNEQTDVVVDGTEAAVSTILPSVVVAVLLLLTTLVLARYLFKKRRAIQDEQRQRDDQKIWTT